MILLATSLYAMLINYVIVMAILTKLADGIGNEIAYKMYISDFFTFRSMTE